MMIGFDGRDYAGVLFDAGGVLVLPDPTVLAPLLATYGAEESVETHRRAHYAAMAAKSRSRADEGDWDDYNRAYVEVVGVAEADLAEAALVLGATRTAHLWRWTIADSAAALAKLAGSGAAVGVVSNATGQIEAVLARAGICQVGDGPGAPVRCVIDSHVVGVAKPDPRIFDHALVHFDGVDRSDLLYVGDSVTMDVEGARAAGLQPVLLDPFDDHTGADFARIASVGDLLNVR
jgi:HAD superfamily hydrolase (TIGR01549 family)